MSNTPSEWLYALTQELPSVGWRELFTKYRGELNVIAQSLNDIEYYSLQQNIFRAFALTPLEDLKVIIVGQDCYYTTQQNIPIATGLAFDIGHCEDGKEYKIPSSLKNIYKEIKNSYPDYKISEHGNLSSWASRCITY